MPDELDREERAIWEKLHNLCLRSHIAPLVQTQLFEICKDFVEFGGKSEGRTCQRTEQQYLTR